MNDHRITVQIKISPETLALLEMSMTEGDTYDEVIRRLVKTPWVKKSDGKNTWFESEQRAIMRHDTDCTITLPEGLSIDHSEAWPFKREREKKIHNLVYAARAVRDDIARTVGIKFLFYDDQKLVENAVSVVMNAKNILELDRAVKAVFDE